MQTEAINIALGQSGNYEKLLPGEKRCVEAMKFVENNRGKICPERLVFVERVKLDADNRKTASRNSEIEAVDAALISLYDPVFGLRLAKRTLEND